MAEATALRNNVLEYPIYGEPHTVVFPMLDADGDLVTGATTPDSEVSKNGDTFVDCTNEATEIATGSGMYYLTLTATEMTADIVAIISKSATSGMKTTPLVLYPRKLPQLRSGTCAGGDLTYVTLDGSASAIDDYYNGCVVSVVIDGVREVRVITDYTGSNQRATVAPAWNTAPDLDDTFIVYSTDMRPFLMATVSGTVDANVITIAAGAVDSIIDEVIEGTYTMRQLLRLMASALFGKVNGGGTATITFRDVGDTKNRIVATVDTNGNRSAVVLTET